MRARSSEPRGFTLPELIAVLILVGVLSAVAFPRLDAALSLRNDAWHDEVVSALRLARQVAVSHRRLVCASVAGASVSLSIAAANPATACGSPLPGPGGGSTYAASTTGSASVTPGGTLYFQPTGRITTDGAGLAPTDRTISVAGSDSITVVGETGHVE